MDGYKTIIRLSIGVAAAVWLSLALFTQADDSTAVLRGFSSAASITTLIYLAYDKWIWSWRLVRKISGKPDLRGTWRGLLHSDFLRDGKPIDPIPTVMRIKQTNSTQFITLFTGESSSVTEQSQLTKEGDDRWRLSFVYSNRPRPGVSHRSEQHQGLCELYVTGKNDSLGGTYFTSRKTKGEITLEEHSKTMYADAKSALSGEDFGQPNILA